MSGGTVSGVVSVESPLEDVIDRLEQRRQRPATRTDRAALAAVAA